MMRWISCPDSTSSYSNRFSFRNSMSSSGMSAIAAARIQLLLHGEEMLTVLKVDPGAVIRDQLVITLAVDFLVQVVLVRVYAAQDVKSCPRGGGWRLVPPLIDKNLCVMLVLVVFHRF